MLLTFEYCRLAPLIAGFSFGILTNSFTSSSAASLYHSALDVFHVQFCLSLVLAILFLRASIWLVPQALLSTS